MSVTRLYFTASMCAACAIFSSASAQDGDKPKTVGNVEGFLAATKGLISASDQTIQLGRTIERLTLIRTALNGALLKGAGSGPPDLSIGALSARAILCLPRANHATIAADAAYLKAATGAIEKTATSSKIDSIGTAIGALFSNYTISVTEDKPTKKKITDITDECDADLMKFGPQYYGIEGTPTAGITDFFSPITALWSAISAIVTPLATAAGQYVDDQNRANKVHEYMKAHKSEMVSAVSRLGKAANDFAHRQRMQAAGAFAERMALIRATKANLPDDPCKTAFSSPNIASPPPDNYMRCYSQAWDKIADNVAAALKAADQYDQFADAGYGTSTAGQSKLVTDVIKEINASLNPPKEKETLASLWTTAVKLIAFGQIIDKALSKENRDAVQKAIDDLVKAY